MFYRIVKGVQHLDPIIDKPLDDLEPETMFFLPGMERRTLVLGSSNGWIDYSCLKYCVYKFARYCGSVEEYTVSFFNHIHSFCTDP
jgi:hypothetical protein